MRLESLEDRRLLATVSTLSDVVDGNFTPGNLSLREAIANAVIGEVISFSVTGTIQLTNVGHTGEIAIAKSLTIQGPGAGQLTIRAHRGAEGTVGDGSRIFNIDSDAASLDVSLSGLTLTGGDVNGRGGAIYTTENLTIVSSVLTGNATSDVNGNSGGAIYNNAPNGLFPTLIIRDTTLSNNHAGDGGGAVFNAETFAEITHSTMSGNTARFSGGAIFNSRGKLQLTNSTLSANSSGYAGGGLINANGTAYVDHVTITGNSAPATTGSGIASLGTEATVTRLFCTIVSANTLNDDVALILGGTNSIYSGAYNLVGGGSGNGAFNQTGDQRNVFNPRLAPLADNGGPTMTHALLPISLAVNRGDPTAVGVPTTDQRGASFPRVFGSWIDIGAFEYQQTVTLVVDMLVDENDGNYATGDLSLREAIAAAPPGATIRFAVTGTIQLGNELMVDRDLQINGPGAGALTIRARRGVEGTVGDGSRILYINDGATSLRNVTITGVTLSGGDSSGPGGAINSTENLTMLNSVISGNTTSTHGGAISHQSGLLTIGATTLSGNRAVGSGGAITSVGTFGGSVLISNSTLSGNMAGTRGGAVNNFRGPLTLANSTLSGNSAGGAGGGLLNYFGTATLTHVTIASNTAPDGSGVWSPGGPETRTNIGSSIIAGNSSDDLGIGLGSIAFVSLGYNLVGSGVGNTVFIGAGDQRNIIDPRLAALADNGGPTATRAPLPGSPAINAGDSAAVPGVGSTPTTDQRGLGFTRIFGGRIDIGAVELQPSVVSADFDSDGDRDGNDFLRWQRGLGSTGAAATHANGNADNDSDVDAADLTIWRTTFGAAASTATEHATAAEVMADPPKLLSPALVDAAMAYQQLLADAPPRRIVRSPIQRGR